MILSGTARVAGVMGWPVGHSLSPRLHGYWLQHHRIDGAYVPMAVRPERIADALRALPVLGFAGANLTVPHKEMALAVMDEVEPLARRVGAVNTVVVRSDGSLLGRSTDGFGFLANILDAVLNWNPGARPVTVIGAGGAAKAIAWALLDHGRGEVRIVNRTEARAQDLAGALGARGRAFGWARLGAALADTSLLVNATTLGMTGQPRLELELSALPKDAIVTDAVYAPLATELLKAARARGNRTVDGIGMLLHQARPGFAAWFGTEPEVTDELRTHVLAGRG